MTVETQAATPQPLPTFQEYFARNDKSFSRAALAWAADRHVLFPLDDKAFDTQIPLIAEVASTFDDRILSLRFSSFTPSLSHAASIICWSEGNPEIQRRKVSVVKTQWQKDAGINPEIVLDLIGEAKVELISKTIMQADVIAESRFAEADKRLPIVIIEDKITNMMKFMKEYIKIAFPDVQIPTESEDSLDGEDFQFDKFLDEWKKAIGTYPNNFRRFSFVYVPPGKEVTPISSLREKRVIKWIQTSNEALKDARAKRSVVPTKLACLLYQYTADQFFHIQNRNTDLSKIITPRSIVVADVDGPLVSQSRVLATREAALQAAYRKMLDEAYLEVFLVGLDEMASYIINPTTMPAVVYSEGDEKDKLLGIGTQFLKKKNYALFLKEISSGKVIITIRRLERDSSFELNLALYKQALESIGSVFSNLPPPLA